MDISKYHEHNSIVKVGCIKVVNRMRKRRPAIIGSKKHKGCCLVCPIISTNRKFTTYIEIKNPKKIDGKVVTHQL